MDDRLNLEILGLLLQVAWADDEITAEETEQILERARAANLTGEHLDRIAACLRGEATLPPPDLGYLRAHKDEALEAVAQLMGADSKLVSDEENALAQIKELLGA
jgi:hypothetical protein